MRAPCRTCGAVHDAYAACVRRPKETTPSLDHQLVGKVLAERYRLGEVIGAGTTGMVFMGEHVSFARPVAVKVVRARHATPDLVSRVFHGDGIAAWSLPHPSLVEVFDIGGLADGTPFYVMERLDGETLATRIARERLSLAAAIDMMMQLLSAIVALHAREILLRDLRPNNVFLAHRRGCRPLVKLLDVGLARLAPLDRLQETWASAGPQPSGHPHYLSPERTRGEHAIDVASDLFVAGTIFYEALAGARAFEGSSWRVIIDAVCAAAPKPLHERRGDVPVELSQFVARSMALNPRSRPATAKEMQDELRSIFEDARKASVSIYAPAASIAQPASRRTPPIGRSDSVLDGELGRSVRGRMPSVASLPAVPAMPVMVVPPMGGTPPPDHDEEPHPAVLEEMEQTLERIPVPEPIATKKAPVLHPATGEEDETQTTQMSAELRARIDQLMQPGQAPKSGNKSRP